MTSGATLSRCLQVIAGVLAILARLRRKALLKFGGDMWEDTGPNFAACCSVSSSGNCETEASAVPCSSR